MTLVGVCDHKYAGGKFCCQCGEPKPAPLTVRAAERLWGWLGGNKATIVRSDPGDIVIASTIPPVTIARPVKPRPHAIRLGETFRMQIEYGTAVMDFEAVAEDMDFEMPSPIDVTTVADGGHRRFLPGIGDGRIRLTMVVVRQPTFTECAGGVL